MASDSNQGAHRSWPTSPTAFDRLIETKAFGGGRRGARDQQVVKALYRRMCSHQLGSTRQMDFEGMTPPTAAEAARLAECLNLAPKLVLHTSGCGGIICRILLSPAPSLSPSARHLPTHHPHAQEELWLSITEGLRAHTGGISTESSVALFSGLAEGSLPSLKQLMLTRQPVGDKGAWLMRSRSASWLSMPHYSSLCASPQCKLAPLSISRTIDYTLNVHSPIAALYAHASGLTSLVDAVERGALPSLQQLHISDALLGDESMHALSEALARGRLPLLQDLCLQSACVADDGVRALAEAIRSGALSMLKGLSLGSQVGDEGMSALSKAIGEGKLPLLETLEIGQCSGDDGLMDLIVGLRGEPRMMQSWGDLPRTRREEKTTVGLAMLQSLTISVGRVSEGGMRALADALDKGALPSLGSLALTQHVEGSIAQGDLDEVCVARDVSIHWLT